jgi:hypothetical protein
MIRDRIDQISQSLERARAAVAKGAALDLEGLCAIVEAAMKEVIAAPLGERDALTASLAGLLTSLDRLAADLARQQRGAASARAAAAYGGPHNRGESET